MAETRKATAAASEAAQETRENLDVSQDTQGRETPPESARDGRDGLAVGIDAPTAQEAAEGAENSQNGGPVDEREQLGCQDVAELQTGELTEYAVAAEGGLRLRERPSLDAPVLAVLPWGVGVFADEPPIGEWVCVTTGLLSGYMLVKYLVPLSAELKQAIVYD